MHESSKNFNLIKNQIKEIVLKNKLKTHPEIIAVTKTFPIDKFTHLIKDGHNHFGENKVQEAEIKWPQLKFKYNNIKLHMLGKLQSNKAKNSIKIFDYIHSLDNEKLANKLSKYEKELDRKVKYFIQVNVADESQKSGIPLNELSNFFKFCVNEINLNIIGLMCLPPIDDDSSKYFKILKETSIELNLDNLSMGMSSDYESAVLNGSTFLRLGTAIFGSRNINL